MQRERPWWSRQSAAILHPENRRSIDPYHIVLSLSLGGVHVTQTQLGKDIRLALGGEDAATGGGPIGGELAPTQNRMGIDLYTTLA